MVLVTRNDTTGSKARPYYGQSRRCRRHRRCRHPQPSSWPLSKRHSITFVVSATSDQVDAANHFSLLWILLCWKKKRRHRQRQRRQQHQDRCMCKCYRHPSSVVSYHVYGRDPINDWLAATKRLQFQAAGKRNKVKPDFSPSTGRNRSLQCRQTSINLYY